MEVLSEEVVEGDDLRDHHGNGEEFVYKVERDEVVAMTTTTEVETASGEYVLEAECKTARSIFLVRKVPVEGRNITIE